MAIPSFIQSWRLINHLSGFTFFALLLSLLTSGCASSGRSTVQQPFGTKLAQFKSASIQVTSTVAKPSANLEEFKVQLESRIIAKLREKQVWGKIYSQVSAGDAKPELNVSVTITAVRDVSNFDRVMWGAMAGQAKTTAKVEVREVSSGKLLGAGDIEGKSSGGSVVAGTTSEAVERVADEVVKLVVDHR
jgi:hypothetical protein